LQKLSNNISTLKIRILNSPITELCLRRPETSEIFVRSKLANKPLPGESIAPLENNSPALSYYKNEYNFNFDPFFSIQHYHNEQGKQIPNSLFSQQKLT
jgi:hypothetical protein